MAYPAWLAFGRRAQLPPGASHRSLRSASAIAKGGKHIYGTLVTSLISDFLVEERLCDWQRACHVADRFERRLQEVDCVETLTVSREKFRPVRFLRP